MPRISIAFQHYAVTLASLRKLNLSKPSLLQMLPNTGLTARHGENAGGIEGVGVIDYRLEYRNINDTAPL